MSYLLVWSRRRSAPEVRHDLGATESEGETTNHAVHLTRCERSVRYFCSAVPMSAPFDDDH